jgi:UDP-N-acetylmuramoyl-tripeptide--D-alanyl-D-alanine ligase
MSPSSTFWNDASVREAFGSTLDAGGVPSGWSEVSFTGISIDSRTVAPGNLLVALEGERFDGHDFVREAEHGGALGAVVSRRVEAGPGFVQYQVPDTLVALGDLAHYRRKHFTGPVIAVTGSVGKTTVKDLLAASLGKLGKVHSTKGNLNNRVGTPLTLLETPEDAGFIVVEIGTSEPGEIATLTSICEPDVGILTTVSAAHLTGLGSIEGVLEEKLDLFRGLRPECPAFVGDVPPELVQRAREISPGVHVTGLSDEADPEYRGEVVGTHDSLGHHSFRLGERILRSPLPGRHGVSNILMALAVSQRLGVEPEEALERMAGLAASPMRGEFRTIGPLTLLIDCYNANPQSTRAALELLAELPRGAGRIAFLGSMLELGPDSGALHEEVLEVACSLPIDVIVGTGEFAAPARLAGKEARGCDSLPADSVDEGYELLKPRLSGAETILLKGSRGVALEKLLPRFERDFGDSVSTGSGGGD